MQEECRLMKLVLPDYSGRNTIAVWALHLLSKTFIEIGVVPLNYTDLSLQRTLFLYSVRFSNFLCFPFFSKCGVAAS